MGFRNRDAAHRLAAFLGRFWSSPARVVSAFPTDRRALADHAALGLTEAQVRGAIRTLIKVGFLVRDIVKAGSRYKPTPDGLRRKPVLHRFGVEFGVLFAKANQRAHRSRQRVLARTPVVRATPVARHPLAAATPISPKSSFQAEAVVIMGDQMQRVAPPIDPSSKLGGALERLQRAIEGSKEVRIA
jgi:hypothetical protein